MSPSEAVYVGVMMVEQKLSSPYYQMTPLEREQKWGELHSSGGVESLPLNEARIQEMHELVQNFSSNVTTADIFTILNRALDILEI